MNITPSDYPSIEEVHFVLHLFLTGLTFFGWYLSYKIRRPKVFRIKLFLVYCIPIFLTLHGNVPSIIFSPTYSLLLLCMFILLLQILYWREVGRLTTSAGYHKRVLVDFLNMLPDMVWMKDLDNRFTYTNIAMRRGILCCTEEEAFGKTEEEIAEMQRKKGNEYTFSEFFCDSDEMTKDAKIPCKFLEFGIVNGHFVAVQVYKAPIFGIDKKGKKIIIGTIGMGRDLTHNFQEHEEINSLFELGKIEEGIKRFKVHKDRYKFSENCVYNSEMTKRCVQEIYDGISDGINKEIKS